MSSWGHLPQLSKNIHDLGNFIVVCDVFFHLCVEFVHFLLHGIWICANPSRKTISLILQESYFIFSCRNKTSIQNQWTHIQWKPQLKVREKCNFLPFILDSIVVVHIFTHFPLMHSMFWHLHSKNKVRFAIVSSCL